MFEGRKAIAFSERERKMRGSKNEPGMERQLGSARREEWKMRWWL